MAHPCQCLLYCHRPKEDISQILIAASGSFLHFFNVLNGQSLCSWSSTHGIISRSQRNEAASSSHKNKISNEDTEHDLERSRKRRKTSPRPLVSNESSSTEIVVEGDDSERDLHSNPIIKLVGTADGRHIVVVTGDDKCLRVFELLGDGTIQQISERSMPKRPCAIAITPDDSRILCGDKFGDVYSLPLLGKAQIVNGSSENGANTRAIETVSQKFVPSATSLTVHTKRNRTALKQQQQMSNREKTEKKTLAFDHRLIFGHVSLLTDLCCTRLLSNSRQYILSADRDEHIRVSRAEPHAHLIAGYCMGHTEFVSKICLIPSRPELLVTGGGDNFLLVWDWLTGTVEQRIDLLGPVLELRRQHFITATADQNPSIDNRFAVSNIQLLEINRNQADGRQTELIITLEGIPALIFFTLDAKNEVKCRRPYLTNVNVIDMIVLSDRSSVIYSVDNMRKPFSTSEDEKGSALKPLIGAIHFSSTQQWETDSDLCERLSPEIEKTANLWPIVPQCNTAKGKSLKELLYGLGNLRKHGFGAHTIGEPAAEEEEDEEEEEIAS